MIYGTHNSLTAYPLVWWERPFGWLINLVSRCQPKGWDTVRQVQDGIRWFNFQVNYYRGKWVGSHGIALYSMDDVLEEVRYLHNIATIRRETIYLQLALDHNLFIKYTPELGGKFRKLSEEVLSMENNYFKVQRINNEYTSELLYNSGVNVGREKYWSYNQYSAWYKRLPLPRIWAKKKNKEYIKKYESEKLMLDYARE